MTFVSGSQVAVSLNGRGRGGGGLRGMYSSKELDFGAEVMCFRLRVS